MAAINLLVESSRNNSDQLMVETPVAYGCMSMVAAGQYGELVLFKHGKQTKPPG